MLLLCPVTNSAKQLKMFFPVLNKSRCKKVQKFAEDGYFLSCLFVSSNPDRGNEPKNGGEFRLLKFMHS